MTTAEKDKQNQDATTQGDAQGWRPEPGDEVTGTVDSIEKGWSDYTSSFYPIVTIKQEDGTLTAVHCFHEILRQRMIDLRPKIGSEITVSCGQRKKTKDGKREFVTYKVTMPGDDGGNTWDALGAQPAKASQSAGQQEPLRDENGDPIPF